MHKRLTLTLSIILTVPLLLISAEMQKGHDYSGHSSTLNGEMNMNTSSNVTDAFNSIDPVSGQKAERKYYVEAHDPKNKIYKKYERCSGNIKRKES